MKDKTYDILKKIFSIFPLISVAILKLGEVWGWPWSTNVATTLGIVATLGLGILQIMSNKYFQEHDIVEMGHITFLNPELHENEEETDS